MSRSLYEVEAAMKAAGFVYEGGEDGLYAHFSWPGGDGCRPGVLMLPLDPSRGDYEEVMAGFREGLAQAVREGLAATMILKLLEG